MTDLSTIPTERLFKEIWRRRTGHITPQKEDFVQNKCRCREGEWWEIRFGEIGDHEGYTPTRVGVGPARIIVVQGVE